MYKKSRAIITIISIVFLIACSDKLKDELSPPGGLIDNARMLSLQNQTDIQSILEAHNEKGPGKITVLTISELPDGVSIENYANELNGSLMSLDNGKQQRILLLIAQKDRKLRIHTSRDVWDLLTDDACFQIINKIITPKFKKEEYFKGIQQGLVAMINELHNTGAQPAAVADR